MQARPVYLQTLLDAGRILTDITAVVGFEHSEEVDELSLWYLEGLH